MAAEPQGLAVEHVVVGVDGSPPSVRALAWTLRAAVRQGWTVGVVTAWPDPATVFVHDVPGHFSAPRHEAAQVQETAIEEACRGLPRPPPIVSHVVNAHPVEALEELGAEARLIVVGSQGEREPRHHARASIGESLALLVHCPVLVVGDDTPGEPDTARPHRLVTAAAHRSRGDDEDEK